MNFNESTKQSLAEGVFIIFFALVHIVLFGAWYILISGLALLALPDLVTSLGIDISYALAVLVSFYAFCLNIAMAWTLAKKGDEHYRKVKSRDE